MVKDQEITSHGMSLLVLIHTDGDRVSLNLDGLFLDISVSGLLLVKSYLHVHEAF